MTDEMTALRSLVEKTPGAEAARQQWRRVADQLRPKRPRLAALMDGDEANVLGPMCWPT